MIESPDTPETYINEEIKIQVKSDCKTDIKSLAYYKLKKGSPNEYEFSGNIYKLFYDDDEKIIGRKVILSKTDDGVKIAEGFSIKIHLIQTDSTLNPAQLKSKYEETAIWNAETAFGPKELSGPGYILLKITENDKEITEDNPSYGYIRVRK